MSKSSMFDPEQYLTKLRGRGGEQNYLEVKWRLVWFHVDNEHTEVTTKLIEHSPGEYAVVQATVRGSVLAGDGTSIVRTQGSGLGSETRSDFNDYLEKAETKALGRALASAGYGTQFSGFDFSYEDDVRTLNEENPARDKFVGVDAGVPVPRVSKKDLAEALKLEVERLGLDRVQQHALEQFGVSQSSRLSVEQLQAMLDWCKQQYLLQRSS